MPDDIWQCEDCRRRLAPPVREWCRRCGAPFESAIELRQDCPHCHGVKFQWERVVALGRYRGELSRVVVRIKSKHAESLNVALAELLFESRDEALHELQADLIVPMPMHWARRIKRGANGPELIAEVLANRMGLSLRRGVLRRQKLTRLQTETSPHERRENQRHSFRVPARAGIVGRRVLLVDNVLTTGATAHEAAKTLRAAGAAAVLAAVIARGIGEDLV